MPLDTQLYPGKFTSVNGQPNLAGLIAPTYNGTLNTYAGQNPNNTLQFKVFQRDAMGNPQSQNQTLINQDNHDLIYKNRDLQFQLKTRYTKPKDAKDVWDLYPPLVQALVPRPYFPPLHPS